MTLEPVVIGAGPAGLSAAWELGRHGVACRVLEAHPEAVGGISRTVLHGGHRFDLGGHRFFSRNAEVERLWEEWLGDWRMVERLSRILYRGRFFDYPLRPWNAFVNLGVAESLRCVGSYLGARLFPRSPVASFEDWVTNAFGERLYRIFFQGYTEKVWGLPCREISADWAAQRIRGLDLGQALAHALLPRWLAGPGARTLAERFRYPRLGPGMLWDEVARRARAAGAEIRMGTKVTRLVRGAHGLVEVECQREDACDRVACTHVISSMPLPHLVEALHPAPPHGVLEAARGLRHRDFLTVALVVDDPRVFEDQWIYVHEPHVRVGRIQDYRNWSPAMVGDPGQSVLGLEYFCDAGDDFWRQSDHALVDLARHELATLGLVDPWRVREGAVVRVPLAYPLYDNSYRARVSLIRDYLQRECPNLQVVGRNGMHRYNNQDHAMLTGLLAARNVAGLGPFDPWMVNADGEYLEADPEGAFPA